MILQNNFMQQNKEQQPGIKLNHPEQNTSGDEAQNKMAENPNPRANENIKHSSFEKEKDADTVGTEITDGEAG
jgi:hypothetical protein